MKDADSSRINAKPIRARYIFVFKAANNLIYMRKSMNFTNTSAMISAKSVFCRKRKT